MNLPRLWTDVFTEVRIEVLVIAAEAANKLGESVPGNRQTNKT